MPVVLFRSLLSLLLTLFCASALIFLAMQVLPGDPAEVMLGIHARADTLAALRAQLGLDQPPLARYATWVRGFLIGDLGISYTYGVPVMDLMIERLAVSFPLAIIAFTLTILIAFPLGMLAVAHRGKTLDRGIQFISQFGIAIPNFWCAMLLVLLFAVMRRWLPSGGFPGWEEGLSPALLSLMLPAVALAIPQGAILTQVTRSALLDTLDQDFIRTAYAKGLSRWQILRRHALRNALIPVLTVMGLQFALLLAGTIIIENVFYLPGLGYLIFQAINQRDFIVVQSAVTLLVASIVVINLLVNIAYVWVDPRLRKCR